MNARANPERDRLIETRDAGIPWKRWGPYLSERQWGTVREDYSADGTAWDYFTHDQARSRAYRWGEDGLAGFSDDKQRLCFSLALWNGNDPILKERLFGLANGEGNHGEDVKEIYYYLDATPTHAYMRYLYKYPQAAFPYDELVAVNRARGRDQHEYELIDTGIFAEDRYFDVFVEYAKDGPDDLLVRVTAHNRGPDAATLHLAPTLLFRNTWSRRPGGGRPSLERLGTGPSVRVIHPELGERFLHAGAGTTLLFTENETNTERIFGTPNAMPYVKDGIDAYVVHGRHDAVGSERGTKVAAYSTVTIARGAAHTARYRITTDANARDFGPAFDALVERRRGEADAFYDDLLRAIDGDRKLVARQAFAGMLWSKQYYSFDLMEWLAEHQFAPLHAGKHAPRNADWFHMINDDVISMPDKWEYPWYAAWDLAFHTLPLAIVDPEFAKAQLSLMLESDYLHPNGQLPAYEWNFSDVNPPVHAFAALWVYDIERQLHGGRADVDFLKRVFQKLLLNFTWWVNRKDVDGRNVFEGGFLGLDNISVFDRSAPLPLGGTLEQADGTAWMAFFSLCMLEIAVELAVHDAAYEDMALKFGEHFVLIAAAMMRHSERHDSLWDEEDGFFYDVLRVPDGRAARLKIRSLVGLLPICAVLVLTEEQLAHIPGAREKFRLRMERFPELQRLLPALTEPGVNGNRLLSPVGADQLRRILSRMLDESEFFGDYGIRSLSRYHQDHPYVVQVQGAEARVDYLPAESDSGLFGGNSNWRGPIWMPVNMMIYRALLQYYRYYGDAFTIECPTGSGKMRTLFEIATELGERLCAIFLRDADGRRPVFGDAPKFQTDPYFRDHLLFYEYFHGDNGAGIGASHQTGWTGLVGVLLPVLGKVKPEDWLRDYRGAFMTR